MEQQEEDKDVISVKKRRLTYRFHNPNPDRELEDYIQKMIINSGVREIFAILQDHQQAAQTAEDFTNTGGDYGHCSVLPGINR